MCILITGGGGFVGCHLIRLLNKIYPDRQIIVIDQHIPNYQFDDALKAEYILGDTVDIVDIMRNYPRPDIVFHLGEFSRIRPSFSMIKDVWHSNCAGTFQVIQFCSQHQIKLIYTGSSSKFGDKNNENMSPYAWFKAKNIELIKNYSQWFGLEYRIGYLCNVYGPGQINSGPFATVIGIFEQQYIENMPLTVIAPGNQRRSFTHVDDICAGLLQLIDYPKNDEFLLGHSKDYSVIEVARLFQRDYVFIPEQPGERFKPPQFDNRAQTELAWQPQQQLDTYIADFIVRADTQRRNERYAI